MSRLLACLGVGMLAGLVATGAAAQSATMTSPVREYLLLGNINRDSGEPMLAVDPTDSNNMVVIGMGNLNRTGPQPVTRGMTSTYWGIPNSTEPLIAVTHNGGRTWTFGVLPILSRELSPDHLPFRRCPDPFAAVTAQGNFLLGCEPREAVPDKSGYYPGGSYLLISTDKGDHWSRTPTPVITSWAAPRFAAGLKPRIGGVASPWDRPYIKVDDSTGIVYGQAGGGQTDIDQPPGHYRTQSYITSSSDGGHSFGTIYSWDSPQYPELGRGGFDVANGLLGVVYPASRIPGNGPNSCPCVVFGASRNRGQSFAYHVIPGFPLPKSAMSAARGPHPGLFPGMRPAGSLDVAADPTHSGRFTVLLGLQDRLDVAVTNDAGATWSPWVTAAMVPGTQPTKTWITYSAQGVLGIVWRAIRPDGSFLIYSVISRDGGRTFSQPLKISAQPSPQGYPDRMGGMFGDDIQDMVVGKTNARMVWGDSRSGFLGTWFAQVPLSAYRFPGR